MVAQLNRSSSQSFSERLTGVGGEPVKIARKDAVTSAGEASGM
jgi:hypothetical protein